MKRGLLWTAAGLITFATMESCKSLQNRPRKKPKFVSEAKSEKNSPEQVYQETIQEEGAQKLESTVERFGKRVLEVNNFQG